VPKLLVEDNKFCPGCGHGLVNRLLAEIFEELGIEENVIAVLAVGCACLQIDTFGVDSIQAIHGRAPAVATGIKRSRPDNCVFTYQGDGDALAIGTAETMHAAIRNENLTAVFVNNGVFGMTGGQMAPTTLKGQITKSSPQGRNTSLTGNPLNIINVLNTLDIEYLARGTLTSVGEIAKTKKYLKQAFENQINKRGYSFIEIVSPCPTNWNVEPLKSMERIKTEVLPVYPVGEFIKGGVKING
jgi:2-oxoglutarate ferredoxin oxidoreductase subunit beta